MRRAFKAMVIAVVLSTLQLKYALVVEAEPFFYGSTPAAHVLYDVTIYFAFASRIVVRGELPYRDFTVEYPPLAIPFFILPRLFTPDLLTYRWAFALEMFAANALAIGLVVRWLDRNGSRGDVTRRLAWYTLVLVLLCPMAACRFDLLVMAWAFAAAYTLSTDRPILGGALAGSGALLKVVPGVVILSGLARGGEGRGRAAAGFMAALATGTGVWLLVSRQGVARMLAYHAGRGVEIESLYAGVLMAASWVTGKPIVVKSLLRSVEVESAWSAIVAGWSVPLQAALVLLTIRRAWKSGRDEPLRYAGAAVLAFLAFGKVLSPQYVLWLIPFLACVEGRVGTWGRRLFLLTCVATPLIFPVGFASLVRLEPWAIALLNFRNALLVGLWTLLIFGPPAIGTSLATLSRDRETRS